MKDKTRKINSIIDGHEAKRDVTSERIKHFTQKAAY